MDIQQMIEQSAVVWNNRDLEAYLAYYHEDCELTAPGLAGKGRDAVATFWNTYMTGFPDNRVLLRKAIGGVGVGAEESVFEGTHTGVLLGADGGALPPTGRRVSISLAGIHTFRDHLVISSHMYYDSLEMLTQLGIDTQGAEKMT